jgi:1-acyl-sn-glycerol-3-phosphate acyltransferase
MARSAGAIAFALYKTFEISALAIGDALVGRLSVARADGYLRDWSRRIVHKAAVDLTVEGLANLPRDRACVYMSNHQSNFDVPILFSVFPGSLRMVAKAELFRIPVFGRALRQSGFVCVDRSGDRQKAEAAMREAGDALHRGINVWLAPEGTRSRDGSLGKFKKGGFILARDAGVEIVPIAIDGSGRILPKGSRTLQRGVQVKVVFGAPIAAAGRDTTGLMQEVRAFMTRHLPG